MSDPYRPAPASPGTTPASRGTAPTERPAPADAAEMAAAGSGEAAGDASRGSTTIDDRVVARIVAEAAAEIGGSGGLGRKVLGVPVPGRRPARTEVRVNGDIVTARVAMSVTYPMPVREVARQVRDGVRGRVAELTGLTVRQVDVDVAELERPGAGERTVR